MFKTVLMLIIKPVGNKPFQVLGSVVALVC